jgi:uncharacterized RDD family membrane protein YckC
MTCQHCQTWNLDDDHRCSRCGRRLKSTSSRISPERYPIAATATARAYDMVPDPAPQTAVDIHPPLSQAGQQPLFSLTPVSRVIPFDSLTSPATRESIRARAAEIARPAPLRTGKVEVSPRNTRSESGKGRSRGEQQRLDFFGQSEVLTQPQSTIICDAPVAPNILRMEAALVDGLLMAVGCLVAAATFRFLAGPIALDKHALPFVSVVLVTIPFLYKLLWAFTGSDSVGMRVAGLRLVDFDGNPPSRERRYQRMFGSIISLMAAGMGLIWAIVDEDALTWHDHMSSTFPTIL